MWEHSRLMPLNVLNALFGSIEEGYWKWMPYNFAFGYDLVQAHKEYSGWTTFGVNPLVYCVMFEGI